MNIEINKSALEYIRDKNKPSINISMSQCQT